MHSTSRQARPNFARDEHAGRNNANRPVGIEVEEVAVVRNNPTCGAAEGRGDELVVLRIVGHDAADRSRSDDFEPFSPQGKSFAIAGNTDGLGYDQVVFTVDRSTGNGLKAAGEAGFEDLACGRIRSVGSRHENVGVKDDAWDQGSSRSGRRSLEKPWLA